MRKDLKKLSMLICIIVLVSIIVPVVYTKYTTSINRRVTINVRKPVYTVVFHSNDGNDYTVNQNFTYGVSQQLTANTFSYSGFFFQNWNTASNGSGTVYDNQQTVLNLSSVDGATIDLYAQWFPDFTVIGNPTNWTNQDVTLTIVLTGGSYSNYEYSFSNSPSSTSWSSSYTHTYSSNQDVYVRIRNNYITSDPKLVSITKIDKVAPVITFDNDVEYNSDHTTTSVTTLIAFLGDNTSIITGVTATDDLSGVASGYPKCYRNNTEISSTSFFTSVGRYAITCKAQDNAGNETTENREVLIRWPLAGKYVVARQGYVAEGLSSSTSQNGLYKDNAQTGGDANNPFASKYYYTGPTVDNYITFANTTFRILNVPTNDDIKVIGDVSDKNTSWGNRKIYESNTYDTWSTKWWPRGQIYNNETGESRYKLFTATEKAHLDLATFYAGRFNKSDATDIASTVYNEQTGGANLGGSNNPAFEGYSAYPNVSDYLKACKAHDYVASIDDTQSNGLLGIGTTKRDMFNDYSWIDMSIDQWTMNSKNLTSTDNDFWVIDSALGGHFLSRTYYYSQPYRVVFYLKNDTILSGTGTSADAFNVEEDWAWFDSYQIVQ